MNKKKIPVLIPLAILGGILIYCWTTFITTDLIGTWRHYIGITMYLIIVAMLFKSIKYSTILLGVYLLFATFSLLAITPAISTSWIRIGPVSTPPVQLLSLGIFILYAILNFNPLVDFYLDYKEAKDAKKTAVEANPNPVEEVKDMP